LAAVRSRRGPRVGVRLAERLAQMASATGDQAQDYTRFTHRALPLIALEPERT
jgi:hypothetical protein